MDIVFIKDKELLGAVYVDPEKVRQIIHGDGAIKEIQLAQSILSEDDKVLQPVYDNINKIDYASATDVIVLYTKDSYFSYHSPIKEIYYRTMAYGNHGCFELKETLSIRFQEDMKTKTDFERDLMFCDAQCEHFKEGRCIKYDSELQIDIKTGNSLVCKMCFLHSSGDEMVRRFRQSYAEMTDRLSDEEG